MDSYRHVEGPPFYAMLLNMLVSLHQLDNHYLHLDERKVLAQATARARTEVQFHDVPFLLVLFPLPPLWNKLKGVFEYIRAVENAEPATIQKHPSFKANSSQSCLFG